MENIDEFASSLLEEAKRFLEKAEDDGDPIANAANLHAALMLAFSSLEAHVNSIGDDFINRPELSVHEKGLLLERKVLLEDGAFKITPVLRMMRLEDRIRFLHVRLGKAIDISAVHWSRLAEATALRNQLTHPKTMVVITRPAVGRAIQAMIDTLNVLYQVVYQRDFPSANRGLLSKLNF